MGLARDRTQGLGSGPNSGRFRTLGGLERHIRESPTRVAGRAEREPKDTGALDLMARGPSKRKLTAVLYIDMVGYSRLIGLDDIGTLERLRALRTLLIEPAIAEHGGRVVQTGGDSLLIVFDSIDGAVRCAVKIQQQVPVLDGHQ